MNIHWEYILSTYIMIYLKDTSVEYFWGIHTLFQNYLIIFQILQKMPQLLMKEILHLPHYLTLQNVSGGELYMPDTVTFNNKTYTLVFFTEYRLI